MTAVVSVVGASGVGKTTLVERVVAALSARGLRVGTIKHASHGFDIDRPGSDSARHQAAGAAPVFLAGPAQSVSFLDAVDDEPLEVLVARHFRGTNLVLVEGFSDRPGPKVLVHRRGVEPREPPPADEVLFAVTDEPLGYPVEVRPENLDRAVDMLAEHIAVAGRAAALSLAEVCLRVDGREVPLTEFVARFVAGAVRGMVAELKGVPEAPESIQLDIRQ